MIQIREIFNGVDGRPEQPGAPLVMFDDMCEQFTRLFPQQDNQYWGEKSLLKVLLNREGEEQPEAFLSDSLTRHSSEDEHTRRRAMIFMLLGLKSAAEEAIENSSQASIDDTKDSEDLVEDSNER
ncbi:MAG TPA: hypothetical protein VK658_03335 [Chryseolinea sp.]|nr:hypothetical protein [Chryseolinea sp.]